MFLYDFSNSLHHFIIGSHFSLVYLGHPCRHICLTKIRYSGCYIVPELFFFTSKSFNEPPLSSYFKDKQSVHFTYAILEASQTPSWQYNQKLSCELLELLSKETDKQCYEILDMHEYQSKRVRAGSFLSEQH